MADDQGWGETGYYHHPVLKTPNIDAMAAAGLRFDRFYAGAPNCSPTRATVMTGRSHDRTGVLNHGYALHRQEKTIAQALSKAGYVTGHFGKWHLDGFRGPGVPILADDTHSPGVFGFQEWLSVTNFFDMNPLMSHKGKFVEFQGDSSEIIVDQALKFIAEVGKSKQPFFTVIWYGSPHSPFRAADADKKDFADLSPGDADHYGELVAMDRSIGTLRKGLRELGLAENTLVWYCSDNGGLPKIHPDTVGGLRGYKGSVYEGGLRVPCVIEWPAVIRESRVTSFPASTLDIFPTIADILDLPGDAMLEPVDGISLVPVIQGQAKTRAKPLPFRHTGRGAWIDNDWKLVVPDITKDTAELYNLVNDPKETTNLADREPERLRQMLAAFQAWSASVDRSQAGLDYPEKRVWDDEPGSRDWTTSPEYAPYLDMLKKRPEYAGRIKAAR
ncbi:MAG: N-acetylgalactosamine 6-sulfate sulfatase [Planctomycetota bacterium]|nr:MAG: N-acetylgalactosamine 6-sulfate sulfatase [Planctomycetota bacterium]